MDGILRLRRRGLRTCPLTFHVALTDPANAPSGGVRNCAGRAALRLGPRLNMPAEPCVIAHSHAADAMHKRIRGTAESDLFGQKMQRKKRLV